jgi:sterol 24-C-methyltransferase
VPFPDNEFDAVYQIEATAHAPDKAACYAEILRVLKPGGVFGSYEWCLTNDYDGNNTKHRQIKKGIEEGDGLPDIATTTQVLDALKQAGFTILEERDLKDNALRTDLTWYEPLVPRYNLRDNFKHTWLGRFVLNKVLKVMEFVHLAPKGTVEVQEFLQTAADSLVESGELAIFTPMYFTVAQKPE